jgi:hypothetical protein
MTPFLGASQDLIHQTLSLAELQQAWQLLHSVIPHTLNAHHLMMYQPLSWFQGDGASGEVSPSTEGYVAERQYLLRFFNRAIAQIQQFEPSFSGCSQFWCQQVLSLHPQWHEILIRLGAYGLIDLLDVPVPDARAVSDFYTRWAIEDGDSHYQCIHAGRPYFLLERIFDQAAFELLHLLPDIFARMQDHASLHRRQPNLRQASGHPEVSPMSSISA